MRDVVRIVVPRMKIIWLVPLGDDAATSLLHFLDNNARIRGVIWIDVDNELAPGALQQRLDVGDAFFRIAFRHQRFIFRINGLGEISAAFGEGRVIRVR
jgi:hypothetical protein